MAKWQSPQLAQPRAPNQKQPCQMCTSWGRGGGESAVARTASRVRLTQRRLQRHSGCGGDDGGIVALALYGNLRLKPHSFVDAELFRRLGGSRGGQDVFDSVLALISGWHSALYFGSYYCLSCIWLLALLVLLIFSQVCVSSDNKSSS